MKSQSKKTLTADDVETKRCKNIEVELRKQFRKLLYISVESFEEVAGSGMPPKPIIKKGINTGIPTWQFHDNMLAPVKEREKGLKERFVIKPEMVQLLRVLLEHIILELTGLDDFIKTDRDSLRTLIKKKLPSSISSSFYALYSRYKRQMCDDVVAYEDKETFVISIIKQHLGLGAEQKYGEIAIGNIEYVYMCGIKYFANMFAYVIYYAPSCISDISVYAKLAEYGTNYETINTIRAHIKKRVPAKKTLVVVDDSAVSKKLVKIDKPKTPAKVTSKQTKVDKTKLSPAKTADKSVKVDKPKLSPTKTADKSVKVDKPKTPTKTKPITPKNVSPYKAPKSATPKKASPVKLSNVVVDDEAEDDEDEDEHDPDELSHDTTSEEEVDDVYSD